MSLFLQDKVFISTRPEGHSDELAQLFSNAGATLIEMPLVKIQSARLSDNEKAYFKSLHQFQWLMFTSANGVRCFFQKLNEIQGNLHLPKTLQLAVIGNKTEQVLTGFGYKATFTGTGSTGEDFADAFIHKIKNEKTKPDVLLALGKLARTAIQDQLKNFAQCTRINLYETIAPEPIDEEMKKLLVSNKYEMMLFTSPSGIQNLLKLVGELKPQNIRMACIGETTSKTAIENHITPLVVAQISTAEGLFKSIINYYKNKNL